MAEQRALQLARGLVGWWAKLSDADPGTHLSADAAHDLAGIVLLAQWIVTKEELRQQALREETPAQEE